MNKQNFFAEIVQMFLGKTTTISKISALVVYLLHAVQVKVSVHFKQWQILDKLALIFFSLYAVVKAKLKNYMLSMILTSCQSTNFYFQHES